MPSVFLQSDPTITANTDPLVLPKPKVHVYFRPSSSYDGEFGFDWLRTGDTGHNGDDWYKNIVGKYRDSRGRLDNDGGWKKSGSEYSKLVRRYDSETHPTRKADKYLTPYVALMPNKKATFSLKLHVKKAPKKLLIIYDEAYFKLNIDEISELSEGKRSLKDHLEIECIKEFETEQEIRIEADGLFAGNLKFIANDKKHRYRADILMVQVYTDLDGNGTPNIGAPIGREAVLKKYLGQALCTPHFHKAKLDLTDNAVFNADFKVTVDRNGDNVNEFSGSERLMKLLDDELKDQHKKDYSDYYKLYFIHEDALGLYGMASDIGGGGRAAMIYQRGFGDSTTAHELFHSMGLYHSFDNDGNQTFEYQKTDNIMDYSDIAVPPIEVISTWHWQWPLIWANVEKEK